MQTACRASWPCGSPASSRSSHCDVVDADEPIACSRLAPRDRPAPLRTAADYGGDFERNWRIASFSSLVRDLPAVASRLAADAQLHDDETAVADTEVSIAAPAPNAAAEPMGGSLDLFADEPWHLFPRGSVPGNFLHDMLEWLATERFALASSPVLRLELLRRCERQGWGHRRQAVLDWLTVLSRTPLQPLDVALEAIAKPLPEMEFWFDSDRLSVAAIDELCRRHLLRGRDRPALPRSELNGMVMGFADLLFEHGGRYWVLDYKSNWLGDDDAAYTPDTLEAAMASHRYDVQAAIYLLALHRLLRSRLGAGYDPLQQLGGAIYLFMRGINGPARGCHVDRAVTGVARGPRRDAGRADGGERTMSRFAAPADDALRRLLGELARWSEQRWIRRLDSAFAALLVDLCPAVPASVVLSGALLAHVEGRGHSCLAVDRLVSDRGASLGLPPLAAQALRDLLAALPSTPADWLADLQACPLVQVADEADPPAASDDGQPLVLRDGRLYLRRYWHDELQVARQINQRAGELLPVDRGLARSWLDRLFVPPAEASAEAAGFDWQKAACGLALAGRLTVLTGGPGTGKTYTAARLLALLLAVDPAPERLRIALAAPTGKAAAKLRQSIAAALAPLQNALGGALPLAALAGHIGPARTLHSLLGARPDTRRFAHDAAHPLEVDVLIVDEASMIHLEMMAALLDALPAGARLILLGDKDQLASVEAGAVLGDLCHDAEGGRYAAATAGLLQDLTGQVVPPAHRGDGPALAQHTVMLRTSRRFSGPIGQLALAVNAGDLQAAQTLLLGPSDESLRWIDAANTVPLLRLAAGTRGSGGLGYRPFVSLLQRRPQGSDKPAFDAWVMSLLSTFERFRILCALREGEWGVDSLNLAIERALPTSEAASSRRGDWYEGRPILVTRNDAGLGVFNGDIGIVLRPLAGVALRAYFYEGDAYRSVAISRLAHVETAFAMTVHKAQGSEFGHCVLVLPQAPSQVLSRELVYTGITRARSALTLVTGRRQALGDALAVRTQRTSGLLDLLQPGTAG